MSVNFFLASIYFCDYKGLSSSVKLGLEEIMFYNEETREGSADVYCGKVMLDLLP